MHYIIHGATFLCMVYSKPSTPDDVYARDDREQGHHYNAFMVGFHGLLSTGARQ